MFVLLTFVVLTLRESNRTVELLPNGLQNWSNTMQEQQSQESNQAQDKEPKKPIAVAVITPSGTFPTEDDYRRSEGGQVLAEILALAAVKLKLTNTTDWVAYANDKLLDVNQTFKHNGLHEIVEIEWHKHEGGGGGA
jgi:hypothetical protein